MFSDQLHQDIKLARNSGNLYHLALLLELVIKSIFEMSESELTDQVIMGLEESHHLLLETYAQLGQSKIVKKLSDDKPQIAVSRTTLTAEQALLVEYHIVKQYLQRKMCEFAEIAYTSSLNEARKIANQTNINLAALREIERVLAQLKQSPQFVLPALQSFPFYTSPLIEEAASDAINCRQDVINMLFKPAPLPYNPDAQYVESLITVRATAAVKQPKLVLSDIMENMDDLLPKNIKSSVFFDTEIKSTVLEFYYCGQGQLNEKRRREMMAQLTHHLLSEVQMNIISYNHADSCMSAHLSVQFGMFSNRPHKDLEPGKPLLNLEKTMRNGQVM